MPKYFRLAYQSFWGKFLSLYFNTTIIINAFFTALLLSSHIILELFGITFWVLHVGAFFLGFGLLLRQDRRGFFWSGAFVGLFWFYWISFSFIHYGFAYLIPVGILGIMVVYGAFFWLCAIWHKNLWIKALALFGIGFITPFGFNWFDWRLLLLDTPFRADMWGVAICFMGLTWIVSMSNRWRVLGFIFFIIALNTEQNRPIFLKENVLISDTFIPQSNKWDPTFLSFQINSIFDSIEKGIKAKKSLILFPESALPLHLNREPLLEEKLLEYSQKITIIVGALSGEKNGVYNSTFLFQKGKKDVAHKVILVPFGEEVPLPEFFEKLINKFFYAGASDFLTARMPQDFIINGEKVRNAICFEATKPELFEKTPGIMVALSNNAWFTPSTQPFLQKRLLRLYATLYKTTIYHSANSADGGIFPPESAIFNLPWQNDLF